MKVVAARVSLEGIMELLLCRHGADVRIIKVTGAGLDLDGMPPDTRCVDVIRPVEPGAPVLIYLQSEVFPVVPEGARIPHVEIIYRRGGA